tara:strand:- start:660 stop:1181 length:522 start_codon:yes stop_codon:yes gene_type:complete
MANKFHTVTVTPTIRLNYSEVHDAMGNLTVIPLPVRDGQSVMLKNISIIDRAKINKDTLLVFMKGNSGDNELGTDAAIVDITDANLITNGFLGTVLHNYNETIANGGPKHTYDMQASQVTTYTDVNIVLTAANVSPSSAPSQTGCYLGLVAIEAQDLGSAADNYVITFGFEVL